MTTITHKRGDTFTMATQAFLDAGMSIPRDLSAVTIASTMEHQETGTRFDLTTDITSATTGNYTISAAYADTAAWELGLWEVDIQFTEAPNRNSTDTFYLNIIKDIT
jgi:hypothetical protein